MEDSYKEAMQTEVAQLADEIAAIKTLLDKRQSLTRLEYRAAERVIQLLVECCIGLAKQKLKSLGVVPNGEARANFSRLTEMGLAPAEVPWSNIVGMRNAIVHGYLNIAPDRLLIVFKKQQYQDLLDFCQQMLD